MCISVVKSKLDDPKAINSSLINWPSKGTGLSHPYQLGGSTFTLRVCISFYVYLLFVFYFYIFIFGCFCCPCPQFLVMSGLEASTTLNNTPKGMNVSC